MKNIFTLIILILSLSGYSQNSYGKTDREQAYLNSLANANMKSTNPSTRDLTTYTTGFDSGLFASYLEDYECVELSFLSMSAVDANLQVGTFTNGIADAGLGIDKGIIMSTGSVVETFTTNNQVLVSDGASDANAIADPDLDVLDPGGQTTHNEAILTMEFTVPYGLDGFKVPFQFASDEYPEYVGTQFNDVFGFFVSGPGISGTKNIALVPGTDYPIAVNSINGGAITNQANADNYPASGPVYFDFAGFHIDNTDGTDVGPITSELDGFSTVLYAEIGNLIQGATYTLKLAISDIADHYGDSAVFIGPLVGSYQGTTFTNCACDLTDPLEDCDGDGITNGEDCNPADADISDEGDSCTDSNGDAGTMDANCICIASGTGTSSGNNGGLESNNRLSQKIAQRNFKRSTDKKGTHLQKQNGSIPYEVIDVTKDPNGLNLAQLIPQDMWGAYVAESSPEDLIGITNAVEVRSADYYLDDVRNAVVLAIKSENGVYEHSKQICDRLSGASLQDVFYTHIGNKSFITYRILTAEGQEEYACGFSGYVIDDEFKTENHWNLDKYSMAEYYYNFQIWSSSIEKTKSLLITLLNNIQDQKELGDHVTGTIPGSFIQNGYYENGQLFLNVINRDKLPSFTFNGNYTGAEGSALEVFEAEVSTNESFYEQVDLNTGYFYDMGLSMVIDEDHSDEIFVADGAWGYDDQNPNAEMIDFAVYPQVTVFDEDVYGIERSVEIITRVKDYHNIFRSITPKWNSINLMEYNSIAFQGSGNGLIRITIVNPTVSEWEEQIHKDIYLEESLNNYNINLFDFENYTAEKMSDINMIMITIIGDNANFKERTLKIEDMNFNYSIISSVSNIHNSDVLLTYPNPVDNVLNVKFDQNDTEVQAVKIISPLGQVVFKSGAHDKSIYSVDVNDFPKGLYYIELIDSNNNTYVNSFFKQ